MDNLVKFERKIIEIGGSYGITIPEELLQFLDASKGDEIIMVGDIKTHGKFIAFWKK